MSEKSKSEKTVENLNFFGYNVCNRFHKNSKIINSFPEGSSFLLFLDFHFFLLFAFPVNLFVRKNEIGTF
ncbi:MAG: hypothetical protein HFI63_06630 [Lachnospiraceae bacterium]|nr:hypothetical protein [Lachnospiraceae bacterium]